MLKVEEKDRLGVISLLFTIELLEDTHMQLWEKPSLGGTEEQTQVKQGPSTLQNRFFYILTVCLCQPYFFLLALDTFSGINKQGANLMVVDIVLLVYCTSFTFLSCVF